VRVRATAGHAINVFDPGSALAADDAPHRHQPSVHAAHIQRYPRRLDAITPYQHRAPDGRVARTGTGATRRLPRVLHGSTSLGPELATSSPPHAPAASDASGDRPIRAEPGTGRQSLCGRSVHGRSDALP
jgi:hypothetical protein